MKELVDEGSSNPVDSSISRAIPKHHGFINSGSPSELHETLLTVLGHLSYLVRYDACSILLLSDQLLTVAAVIGYPQTEPIEGVGFDLQENPQLKQIITGGMPVISPTEGMTSIFNHPSIFTDGGAYLLAPLIHQERPIGLLVLFREDVNSLTEFETRSTMAFAHQAALVIENARLYTEIKQRAAQLKLARQIGQKVISILDLDKLLLEAVRLIQSEFGYYHVHIFLADEDTNEIVLQELSGEADDQLRAKGLRLKIGTEGITGWVAGSGKPLLCNDVTQEPRYHPHELLPKTRSEVAVPMQVGGQVVGVLDIQSEQLNAFSENDLTAFQILTDQIAVAVENAHLFQKTQQQIDFLRALHTISLEITAQLELKPVLDSILRQASRFLNVQGSVLWSYEREKKVLRKIASYNPEGYEKSEENNVTELQVGEGVAGQVISTQAAVFVNDYHSWHKRSPKFKGDPYNAVLGAPLRWQGQVIGALVVLNDRELRPFTEDDARFLSLFADLASIAIKNAELYEALRKSSEELEQKVMQRTEELKRAEQALAKKAEQLRRLLRVTVNVQEEERKRIALDLHDGSNQLITGVLYEIQAAEVNIRSGQHEKSLEKLETAKQLLNMIAAENRRMIAGLRPPLLDTEGLVAALKWHIDTFQAQCAIQCMFRVSGEPIQLQPEIEMAIYRIVQESLNNVAKHARARNVQILVRFFPARLYLFLSDDGVGFNPEAEANTSANHLGLIGMQERVESIGGYLDVQSKPGRGTRLLVTVPLQAKRAPEKPLARPGLA